MYGKIAKIDAETTTILTEENKIIVINSLFLPVKLRSGDTVELENDRIVLR